jgi:hypothetical protein
MKSLKQLLMLALLGLSTSLLSAADARDKIASAAKQLGEKPGYSWTTSTRESDGRGGPLGPIDGKFEKSGLTWLSFIVGGLPVEVYMQGTNGTAKAFEGWQTFDEVARTGASPAAVIRYLRAYQTPVAEAAALAGKVKELKPADDALAGELPEDTVKEMLLIGARRRDGQEPQAADAKGTIKYWLKDGALAKYEINVQGKVTSGDRESVINRTVKVEIKDVDVTKLEVPAEAKQKMS